MPLTLPTRLASSRDKWVMLFVGDVQGGKLGVDMQTWTLSLPSACSWNKGQHLWSSILSCRLCRNVRSQVCCARLEIMRDIIRSFSFIPPFKCNFFRFTETKKCAHFVLCSSKHTIIMIFHTSRKYPIQQLQYMVLKADGRCCTLLTTWDIYNFRNEEMSCQVWGIAHTIISQCWNVCTIRKRSHNRPYFHVGLPRE